jgi:hypothetical protein
LSFLLESDVNQIAGSPKGAGACSLLNLVMPVLQCDAGHGGSDRFRVFPDHIRREWPRSAPGRRPAMTNLNTETRGQELTASELDTVTGGDTKTATTGATKTTSKTPPVYMVYTMSDALISSY